MKEVKRPTNPKECLSCYKIFFVYPYRISEAKYCSQKCHFEAPVSEETKKRQSLSAKKRGATYIKHGLYTKENEKATRRILRRKPRNCLECGDLFYRERGGHMSNRWCLRCSIVVR